MTDYKLIDLAYIGKSQFNFTLPKKVREELEINSTKNSLGYFQEVNGDISIGSSGENLLAASSFSPTYSLRLRKKVQKKINVELGDALYFYKFNNKIIISGKQL